MMPEHDDQVENVIPMCDRKSPRELAQEAVERWKGANLLTEQKPEPKRITRTPDQILGVGQHDLRYVINHAGANTPAVIQGNRFLNWLKKWSDKL